MKFRSLHARLIAGAALWTLGIMVAAYMLGTMVLRTHPKSAQFIHYSMLTLMGAVLVSAGVSVIRSGLSPLRTLRERLADVRSGRTPRLEGTYPTEVVPLVTDLNDLLEDRERRVARAMAKAGDLAHGLKTPLAVLANEAARLSASGQEDLASVIDQQVTRMRRQIEYQLAQARAASGTTLTARSSVAESVDGLVRTLSRIYGERALTTVVRVDSGHVVRCQREDLDEMLGNLLENACKWASSRIEISTATTDAAVVVTVEDDGAGIEREMREAVLQRGVRADQAAPGSGLGLAIVRDLADLYGGAIALDDSALGGLRARLTLPAAALP